MRPLINCIKYFIHLQILQELDEEVQVQPVKIRNSNAKDVDTFAGHINIEKENELNKNIINVLLAILKKRNELE